jgi:hypothetical protein
MMLFSEMLKFLKIDFFPPKEQNLVKENSWNIMFLKKLIISHTFIEVFKVLQ